MKLSIIVPVYNVEKYLAQCLDSLVHQTVKDYEVIVVNDGSPDNSQSIIDDYAARYPELVVPVLKKNGGVSDARNYGMSIAKGEFFGFVDSVMTGLIRPCMKSSLRLLNAKMLTWFTAISATITRMAAQQTMTARPLSMATR